MSLLQSVEDWDGRRWTFAYDSNANLTAFTTPLGCQTQYGYTIGSSSVTLIDWIEDPNGYITCYQYNSSNQVSQMTAGSTVWTYSYGATSPQAMVNPAGGIATFGYATSQILSTIQRPQGYTSTLQYSNTVLASEQIPAGVIFSATFDPTTSLPLTSQDALGFLTSFQYDQVYNLTTYQDATGAISAFVFDSHRNNTVAIDPLGAGHQ